jgi:hypothetical protein
MTGGDEVFTFLTFRWNVTRAWRLAEGREAVTADVSSWWAFLGPPPGQAGNAIGLVRVDDGHAATVDLSRPLLFVTHPDFGPVLIDGWHRLRKAQIAGQRLLPVVVLTEDEEDQVRIAGGGR